MLAHVSGVMNEQLLVAAVLISVWKNQQLFSVPPPYFLFGVQNKDGDFLKRKHFFILVTCFERRKVLSTKLIKYIQLDRSIGSAKLKQMKINSSNKQRFQETWPKATQRKRRKEASVLSACEQTEGFLYGKSTCNIYM